jgi:DNA-binding transcriptional MerR regulator
MAAAEKRRLSPAEIARRLRVSAKALRLYEARGLLKPLRSEAGWRTYGASEITRLHHILALKRLGLPLAQIAEILSRRTVSLERVLVVQEDALSREQSRVNKALALVRAARRKLATGHTLSIDDLIQLIRETTMTTQEQREEMKAIFDPIAAKHFTEEERAALRGRPEDRAELVHACDELIAEARALMARGDPRSPEAKDLARRWKALGDIVTGGNPEIMTKAKAMWNEAMADPEVAPKLAPKTALMAFMEEARKAVDEADIVSS